MVNDPRVRELLDICNRFRTPPPSGMIPHAALMVFVNAVRPVLGDYELLLAKHEDSDKEHEDD